MSDPESSFPLAAQIPLQSFTLPTFPPEAAHLRALTLTADIKLDEYQSLVSSDSSTTTTAAPATPNLPTSLTSLTLELFHLGFPASPAFLTSLAASLPNLTSLTLYSMLLDGLSPGSRTDAGTFFRTLLPNLQTLHIIDSFARPGFVGSIADSLARAPAATSTTRPAPLPGTSSLKILEISYTYRGHQDLDFLTRLAGDELPALLVPGLVGASFNLIPEPPADPAAEPANGSTEPDPDKAPQGILPFASDGRAAHSLRRRIETLSSTGGLRSLRALNLALYTLRPAEVGEVLYACAAGGPSPPHTADGDPAGLVDATFSILLEADWWPQLLAALADAKSGAAGLEALEIVGVPASTSAVTTTTSSEPGAAAAEPDAPHAAAQLKSQQSDVAALQAACPKLARFEMSILRATRAGVVRWTRGEGGAWRRSEA